MAPQTMGQMELKTGGTHAQVIHALDRAGLGERQSSLIPKPPSGERHIDDRASADTANAEVLLQQRWDLPEGRDISLTVREDPQGESFREVRARDRFLTSIYLLQLHWG
jgi:hypothetical protein